MLRQTLPLLLAFVPIAAHAQNQAAVVIQSGGTVEIPVPTGANNPRIQVLIAGSNTILDDERANIKNGVATGRLEADPGSYDIRLVTNDKDRTPISATRTFQIPGFKREAGRWLFNGSSVVFEGPNPPAIFSTSPILNRSKKAKLPLSVPTTGGIKWDVATFGANFTPASDLTPATSTDVTKSAFQQQKDALATSNPNGALLLTPPASSLASFSGPAIDALAPLADGIVIDCNAPEGTPLSIATLPNASIKIARRNVEETPNFDLPLFARFVRSAPDSQLLRAFQDGASNIIVPEGASSPVLDVLSRQSARFSGAVTLEDVGLRVDDFDRFAPYVRRAGRSPLLARLPGEGNSENKDNGKNAESLMVAFDESTTAAVLDNIEKAVKIGATIYCEGNLPPALLPRWAEITKTQITPLPELRKSIVTLADPWFWGTINDQNFDVTQSVAVTVKESIAAQTKETKGLAREIIARPIARFTDEPNAIMLCPVEKGRIIWAPFNITPPTRRVKLKIANGGIIYDNELDPTDLVPSDLIAYAGSKMSSSLLTAYYAALAGAMQAALAEYSATKGNVADVSVALRAIPADSKDPKSTTISLIAFFNSSSEEVDINTEVRGNGNYALDLMTSKTVPVKVRDFGIRMALQIPANGFRWLAIAQDEQTWNNAGKGAVKAQIR